MTKDKIVTGARGVFAEFKSFALKGNALELAFAVVIGTAFTGIVNSLVGDVITPLLGLVSGSGDYKNLAILLRPAEESATGAALMLRYGAFLHTIFNFLLISISIFAVFKIFSSARKRLFTKEEEKVVPAYEKPAQERLLEEIRDLLKEQKSDSV